MLPQEDTEAWEREYKRSSRGVRGVSPDKGGEAGGGGTQKVGVFLCARKKRGVWLGGGGAVSVWVPVEWMCGERGVISD